MILTDWEFVVPIVVPVNVSFNGDVIPDGALYTTEPAEEDATDPHPVVQERVHVIGFVPWIVALIVSDCPASRLTALVESPVIPPPA